MTDALPDMNVYRMLHVSSLLLLLLRISATTQWTSPCA
ncbi:hypothetical protein MBELCI_0715 [Limimaricola cinnabarinus LL-001]|uniref:Uncharacterized protein n=1 Tax=Limimaricola cinnabarinus LL-001 TaxID=1337093 RepID=U3AIN7_9RHOB|nr:hypothetical protein MBELCI_0715 [Limimaricola cinnabarinus LL-001]